MWQKGAFFEKVLEQIRTKFILALTNEPWIKSYCFLLLRSLHPRVKSYLLNKILRHWNQIKDKLSIFESGKKIALTCSWAQKLYTTRNVDLLLVGVLLQEVRLLPVNLLASELLNHIEICFIYLFINSQKRCLLEN